ncbi:hypothetical protein EJ02DRAFT_354585 [Clathrospora elynae]|uniref:60S acidic ribosomal protein P2 n=1 Tax=Clathrospora elynae TaxID=706981 RepID=A0A6A5SEG7_9PLEO|nr:hypothetical protein EJ02DRAFT_354585 [Clathrospora elynae]
MYTTAYMLLALGENKEPSAKDVKNVLASVGIEADPDRLNTLVTEFKGKDMDEVRRVETHQI